MIFKNTFAKKMVSLTQITATFAVKDNRNIGF
jgi:hypothetical protein